VRDRLGRHGHAFFFIAEVSTLDLNETLEQDPPGSSAEPTAVGSAWQALTRPQSPAAFHRGWLALQCAQLTGVRAALLLLESDAKTFMPAAVWPGDHTDVTYLGPVAERCLREQVSQIDRSASSQGHALVAYPVRPDGRMVGAVVLDLTPRAEDALQAALQVLYWGTGRLEGKFFRRALDDIRANLARSTLALEFAVGVGDQRCLDDALIRLVNGIALRLQCERVAVGFGSVHGRVRLHALSGSAGFDRKADFVAALENVMEEALDQGGSVCWPPLTERDGATSVAHRDLAQMGAVYSVILAADGELIGAITCQLAAARDAAFRDALQAIAVLVAPQLKLRRELSRGLTGAWPARGKQLLRGFQDPRRPGFWAGAIIASAAIFFLAVAEGPYRVAARSAVEGEVQRAIVAPFEGFVASARLRAGQHVKAGEELASLDDRDLRLEQQKWRSESDQIERKYRDSLAKHDRPNARILSAQLAEADAQLSLTEQKLSRARLIAPFDGVVVTGDLSQMLGSPVEKGKLLFEVAPLDAYRVVLKIAEEDIRHIKVGQSGELVLAGMSDRRLPFAVKNIGIATAEDGQNLFRVEAQLIGSGPSLRPGMEGVGKITVGERHYAWIWTHSLSEWLSVKLWRWLP
jgi:hypothetical protein